jgi:excisionase family DNA binding protein
MKDTKTKITSRLLTVREAGELTGYQPGTIRGWVNARMIPAVRIAHTIRIRDDDLQQFIERNTVAAAPPPKKRLVKK